jgi:hypothetical protein
MKGKKTGKKNVKRTGKKNVKRTGKKIVKKAVKKTGKKTGKKTVKKTVKKTGKTAMGRGKRAQSDSEAALQRELEREKKEGAAVVGDMGKNRNLSGSSTWETLKPPRSNEPKSASKPANKFPARATDATADIARVGGQLADRLRHRGVRLTGQEKAEELADLMDAVERFEGVVEEGGGDLMMDEPTKPGARVSPDQPDFVLPQRRDNESVAQLITRIAEAGAVAAKRKR